MPESTSSSAGVSTREIDLSFRAATGPVGIPAAVIGTATSGPAFIPVTVANFSDFISIFGSTHGQFGPLAVNEWLKNSQALTYVRVLGCGDGKQRNTSGTVTNAGFIVGDKIVQSTGLISRNPYAVDGGPPGRTHFLGCFMSESQGSTVFTSAGLQKSSKRAIPILRGVLMAPSGVVLMMSGMHTPNGSAKPSKILPAGGANIMGSITGSVDLASAGQNFTLLLNGHTGKNVLNLSFDMEKPHYFGTKLNRSLDKLEELGHYLYTSYDIHPGLAAVTGSDVINQTGNSYEHIGIITTGSLGRNAGSSVAPNYENFEDRYSHAKSPYFTSQKFGGKTYDLFKLHALDDGPSSSTKIKVSIKNIKPSASDVDKFGTFDLVIRRFQDIDADVMALESFSGLSLDPSSPRYIARIIGDRYTYFDFDKKESSQKLITAGNYPPKSSYVRVEMSDALKAGQVPDDALPVGYRGPSHLVTSGSTMLAGVGTSAQNFEEAGDRIKELHELPIPMRENIYTGESPSRVVQSSLFWGVQFESKFRLGHPNAGKEIDNIIPNMTRYFPTFQTSNLNFQVGDNAGAANINGSVLDSDKFNNNSFSLENIKIVTGSDGVADSSQWMSASYVRDGNISKDDDSKTRRLKVSDLTVSGNRNFCKFTTILQGGFAGTDMFNKDRRKLNNNAARREMTDSLLQGGVAGPTVASFRQAIDIIGNKSDIDIKLLAIPGIRHEAVTDYAIDAVESRFDAMYIMDVEDYDVDNQVVTSSIQNVSVKNTVSSFTDRALDTSFAAAYFPDVTTADPSNGVIVRVPPSVVVLGAFSLNDTVGHPWFAPAGFARSSLGSVIETTVKFNQANLDTIYDADINPLATPVVGRGMVVWGQKTLLRAQSSLDRVNVRRLLIEVRRQVRAVANTLLFEPNRSSTLSRFESLVTPILQSVQDRSGLTRYKVVIDTTTTTQSDVENNTIRGKVFLQPTRTAEFISLDFVVANAGEEI